MSLVDIMSEMRLHMFAEIALFIFMAMFVAVVIYVFRKHNQPHFESARQMPLDDDHPQEPRDPDGKDEGVDER